MDADHDGKITKDEVLKVYAAIDKNNDGAVTRGELAQAIGSGFKSGADDSDKGPRQERPRHAGPGHRHPHAGPGSAGPPGSGSVGPQRQGPPSAEQLLQRFDKAKKGSLSKEDVPERLWNRISNADANKDGVVSKEELETHFKNLPSRGPRPEKPADKQPQEEVKPQAPKPDDSKPQARNNDVDQPADATVVSNA